MLAAAMSELRIQHALDEIDDARYEYRHSRCTWAIFGSLLILSIIVLIGFVVISILAPSTETGPSLWWIGVFVTPLMIGVCAMIWQFTREDVKRVAIKLRKAERAYRDMLLESA